MKGVIAAGSKPTIEAGAEILRQGGNAIDALVAASFAVAAGEPTVTSLVGGGMLVVRSARTGKVSVCDFFANAPLLSDGDVPNLDFYGIDLSYGPTTQKFHVGAGAAGVPGVIPGLCQSLERWGTMDLATVVKPACSMLREGAILGARQAAMAEFLEPILTVKARPRAVFAPGGQYIRSGDRFALPQLANTIEALASHGWRDYYDSVLVPKMLAEFGPDAGGLLTAEDFEKYEVIFREPLQTKYRDTHVYTVPAPAAGGPMIAFMLNLLETDELSRFDVGSTGHARRLCAAMALADEVRLSDSQAMATGDADPWRDRYTKMVRHGLEAPPKVVGGPSSTTHISVVDAQGNAAGMTFSYGESNAEMLGDTGIMMNNLLGEDDLQPAGFGTAERGVRLATMMSPTLLIGPEGGLRVMGTGGSNRIRTAILEVITAMVDGGCSPAAAVDTPRLHYENGILNAEIFGLADGGQALSNLATRGFVSFDEPNLYFGGVNLAERDASGGLRGQGDCRRGGVSVVV